MSFFAIPQWAQSLLSAETKPKQTEAHKQYADLAATVDFTAQAGFVPIAKKPGRPKGSKNRGPAK